MTLHPVREQLRQWSAAAEAVQAALDADPESPRAPALQEWLAGWERIRPDGEAYLLVYDRIREASPVERRLLGDEWAGATVRFRRFMDGLRQLSRDFPAVTVDGP